MSLLDWDGNDETRGIWRKEVGDKVIDDIIEEIINKHKEALKTIL
jgi:hypothetical protein